MGSILEEQSWKFDILELRHPLSKKNATNSDKMLAFAKVISSHRYDIGNKLYKYMSVSDDCINSIKEDLIWISYSNILNDPFECELSLGNNMELLKKMSEQGPESAFKDEAFIKEDNEGEYVTLRMRSLKMKINSILRNEVDSEKSKIGICSLSERKDSILMWSHYANQHKGICIEYDFIKLNEKYPDNIFPVIYDTKLFDYTPTMNTSTNIESCVIRASITKAIEWSYEKEWRLLIVKNDLQSKGFLLQVPTPSKIYLGCRIDDKRRNDLISVCRDKKF